MGAGGALIARGEVDMVGNFCDILNRAQTWRPEVRVVEALSGGSKIELVVSGQKKIVVARG